MHLLTPALKSGRVIPCCLQTTGGYVGISTNSTAGHKFSQASHSARLATSPISLSLFCFFLFSLRYATRCVSFTTATVDTKHPGLASLSMMSPTISRRSRGRTVLWIRHCARSNGIHLNINQMAIFNHLLGKSTSCKYIYK